MTSVSKNVHTVKLDEILNKYNNTCHGAIKMKPLVVKSKTSKNFNKENTEEDPKFKVADHERISKKENISAKGYIPNWSKEVFVFKKIKNAVSWRYIISDLNSEQTKLNVLRKRIAKNKSKKV